MPSRLNPRRQIANGSSSQQDENEPNQRSNRSSNNSSQNEGRKRPRRNQSAPPSTITVPHQQDERAIIIQLSYAFNEHRDFHSANPGGDHSDRCLKDLDILKKILPKVERKYRYRPRATVKESKYKEPEAVEVMQLCTFYRFVMQANHCPEHPAMFQTPDKMPNVHEVLHRATYVFQQLTCPKLIAHTQLGKASADSLDNEAASQQSDKACHQPNHTIWIIEKTITHLLDFLLPNDNNRHHPTSQHYATLIQRDLLRILTDLAILSEYIIEPKDSQTATEEEATSVQLVLFSQINSALAHLSNKDPVDNASPPEYLLDVVLEADVILSLQCATLNALAKWQNLRQDGIQKIVEMPEPGESQVSQQNQYNAAKGMAASALESPKGNALLTLLASLRPIFFSQSVSVLSERARSAALELLVQPGLLSGMNYSLLLEVSLLIIHAIGGVLLRRQQWKHYAASCHSDHPPTQADDGIFNLMVLLKQTMMFPPRVRGYTESDVKSMLRRTTLMPLLELCLPWIRPSPKRQCGNPPTMVQRLEELVLRTIHVCLLTDVDTHVEIPLGNSSTRDILNPLFELMKDSHLSPVAASIVNAILKSRPMDVTDLCASVWARQHSVTGEVSSQQIPPPPPAYPEELLQVNPDENNGLSPTKASMASPRPKSSVSKNKRRPSLLGDNPLTIRSPLAKRMKHESTGAPLNSNSAVPPKGFCFAEDLIQSFLLQGLQSSRALLGHVSSMLQGGTRQPEKLKVDAGIVAGSLHLLFCLDSKQDPSGICSEDDTLLSQLLACWLSLATLVYDQAQSHRQANSGYWTIEWQSLAEDVVSCGLHYFHSRRQDMMFSPESDAVFCESCTKCCAALALIATAIDSVSPSSKDTQPREPCRGPCRYILGALAVEETVDIGLMSSEVCVCGLTESAVTPESCHGTFQFDCALFTVCALPLSTRCCILSALCEQNCLSSGQQTNDVFALPPTWLSLRNDDSPFQTVLEVKPLVWNDMACSAMVLAPFKIITSCLDPEHDDSAGEPKSHLGIVLNDFLRTVMLPAIETIKQQEGQAQQRAVRALSIVMRQIQWLHLLLDEQQIGGQLTTKARKRWDLCFALEVLRRPFTMELSASNEIDWNNPNSGAYDALRREITFRLSNTVIYNAGRNDEKTLTVADLSPSERVLKWNCVAWECLKLTAAFDLKQIIWLVRIPFSDPDEMVRSYTSRELGKVLLTNDGCGMFALFSDLDEASRRDNDGEDDKSTMLSLDDTDAYAEKMASPAAVRSRQKQRDYSDRVVSAVFNEIDALIKYYCEDAFVLTPTSSSSQHSDARERASWAQREVRARRVSTLRVLASLCRYADVKTPVGKAVMEHALVRLVKLLALSSQAKSKSRDYHAFATSGASLGELERLSRQTRIKTLMDEESAALFVGTLVCECLLPPSSSLSKHRFEGSIGDISPAIRESRYFRLYGVLRAILVKTSDRKLSALNRGAIKVQKLLKQLLPDVLAQMVQRCDYDSIRLFTGFIQHFLKEVGKAEERTLGNRSASRLKEAAMFRHQELFLGIAGFEVPVTAVDISTETLEDEIYNICLTSDVIASLLPEIFMLDEANLKFFTHTVLKGRHALKDLFDVDPPPVIKGLCRKLGGDPETIGPAIHALKAAAIAICWSPGSMLVLPNNHDSPNRSSNDEKTDRIASQLVSSHFMLLIVNLIQFRWKFKSDKDKLHSLRCLNVLLNFLVPTDAPQYITQILAAVNVANEEASNLSIGDKSRHIDCAEMRLQAVQALSKYCRLVDKDGGVCLGQNLTTIVVSLIPALSEDPVSLENTKLRDLIKRASKAAVGLLEFLTLGSLGKALAPSFKEIPFLPTSSLLDNVRANLKSNGVDFDNLLVMTQNTSSIFSCKEAFSGAGSVGSVDGKAASMMEAKQQGALSKRIDTVCGLLGNENVSIRRVILEHLLNLLRANRALFASLVDIEGSSSLGRFLTVEYELKGDRAGDSSFSVTKMMGTLMSRCVLETDAVIKSRLGACLGEVGAISEQRLGSIRMSKELQTSDSMDQSASSWRLARPPWKSQIARYELQLVKRHLVVALKAAQTSSEQFKIAYAIQQLLQLLDRSAQERGSGDQNTTNGDERAPEMGSWLKSQLVEAGVFETVEQFWSSEFNEVEPDSPREPPFFRTSDSYFTWLSQWCRFMVRRSGSGMSPWKELFHSFRTAVRAQVGLPAAEFILPLLLLDRLCFGDLRDKTCILKEMLDVLMCNDAEADASKNNMPQPERRQAVNTVFMVLETWQYWVEAEKEESSGQSSSLSASRTGNWGDGETWTADDSIDKIQETLARLPLRLQAKAAASVGMHALALRILEKDARKSVVEKVFNSTSGQMREHDLKCKRGYSIALADHVVEGADLKLMKDVLAELNNCETMAALEENNRHAEPRERTLDSIRQNEASGNWEEALRDYERVQQLRGEGQGNDPKLQWGALRCLLELGQFESVLNQVNGIAQSHQSGSFGMASKAKLAKPFAVEAAWRLGRWSTLADLVENKSPEAPGCEVDPDGVYQIAQGQAILGLHKKNMKTVATAIDAARQAVMDSLSSAARESYSRAYPFVVRLQGLRELEDAAECICAHGASGPMSFADRTTSESRDGWGWQKRLDLMSPSSSAPVTNTRVALARLAKDPLLEGSLFLTVGKKARKSGLFNIAADSLTQAEAVFNGMPRGEGVNDVNGLLDVTKLQLAKLKHDAGHSSAALKMLGLDQVQQLFGLDGTKARQEILSQKADLISANETKLDDDVIIDRFSRRVLQSTHWIVAGGLKDGGEIINRFRLVQEVAPQMEKGHFHCAKYVDSAIQSRVSALMSHAQSQQHASVDEDRRRGEVIYGDPICQSYILMAMKNYIESLKTSSKHVYHALPRLLSLWFELTGIAVASDEKKAPHSGGRQVTYSSRRQSGSGAGVTNTRAAQMLQTQRDANELVAVAIRKIPPRVFYTAIPQLIAQIMHVNGDTAYTVRNILTRVLARFPEQAMWPLAWLRKSKNSQRKKIGEKIFADAAKHCSDRKRQHESQLLVAAKTLLDYLHACAIHDTKTAKKGNLSLSPWRGDLPLAAFIPPIALALTAVLPPSNSAGTKDLFPREVPRLRDMSPQIKVMNSKARPKRLTAFVIPAASLAMVKRYKPKASKSPQQGDIGELHFLVKEEARGDLRKDARVQDLNTVINRLMASSCDSGRGGCASQSRQLRLRTFAVTCLSEYTGLLEWVPNTTAMRMLIQSTNNPQADIVSAKGRGSRVVDFGNTNLRVDFEKCQKEFFENGNLAVATSLFESLFIKNYPPVFYWWFVKTFKDPHAWYEARTTFTLSAAAWSAVGHVIGLGDRHSENILIDTTSGACVHVDFDCIFDKGLNLPRPEIVPFRLTANMIDAFGPTGTDGVYSSSLKLAMTTLRHNRDTLLSVLEPFIKDPIIDWKRTRSTQSPKKMISKVHGVNMTQAQDDRQTKEAKHSIKVIDERLRGIYNLRNPNIKKYLKRDSYSVAQTDESLTQLLPLSVEGQVHKMIAEATSSQNVVQLYVGWMPWC